MSRIAAIPIARLASPAPLRMSDRTGPHAGACRNTHTGEGPAGVRPGERLPTHRKSGRGSGAGRRPWAPPVKHLRSPTKWHTPTPATAGVSSCPLANGSSTVIEFDYQRSQVRVERGKGPSADAYLYLYINGREFFLAVFRAGMTRGDVLAEFRRFAREHPEHFSAPSRPRTPN